MKIGWLVWYDMEAKERGDAPEFRITEPERYETFVRIVYAVIEE